MSAHARADLVPRRFTVEEFERMGQVGIFTEDDRVELLGGEIVSMTPIGPVHAGVVNRLNRLLVLGVGDRAIVGVQNPFRLAIHSEPQPDLALLRPRRDFYQLFHPAAEDVFLVIEVADTSLTTDRKIKVPLYAAAGVPEVWIVDTTDRKIEVHRDPAAGEYRRVHIVRSGQTVAPAAFEDVLLDATDLLG